MFVGGHFLFTSSDTFAVGCIVQPQHTAKNRTFESSVWNSHGQRGHITVAILDAVFWRFGFAAVRSAFLATATLLVWSL